MILIVCVDEKNGMLFNNRRQSRDRNLISRVLEKTKNNKLWITEFSKDIFNISDNKQVVVDNCFFDKIENNDFCFVENIDINTIIDKVDKIITYNWNRHYPADLYLDIYLNNWIITSESEFAGSSHEKITERIYVRRAER